MYNVEQEYINESPKFFRYRFTLYKWFGYQGGVCGNKKRTNKDVVVVVVVVISKRYDDVEDDSVNKPFISR